MKKLYCEGWEKRNKDSVLIRKLTPLERKIIEEMGESIGKSIDVFFKNIAEGLKEASKIIIDYLKEGE